MMDGGRRLDGEVDIVKRVILLMSKKCVSKGRRLVGGAGDLSRVF